MQITIKVDDKNAALCAIFSSDICYTMSETSEKLRQILKHHEVPDSFRGILEDIRSELVETLSKLNYE